MAENQTAEVESPKGTFKVEIHEAIRTKLKEARKSPDFTRRAQSFANLAKEDPLLAGELIAFSMEEARTDALTGLPNRLGITENGERLLAERKRQIIDGVKPDPLTVLYLDVDGLKKTNDSKSHDEGDKLLIAVARAINTTTRETDHKARYGGDEYVVILERATKEEARVLAERLQKNLKEQLSGTDLENVGGVSIGIHEWDGKSSWEVMLSTAERFMKIAKDQNKVPGEARGNGVGIISY